MKKLIFVLAFISIITACDPPRFCTEPKCINSDVNAEVPVIFTGNMDSVINIGDTLRVNITIPNELNTDLGGTNYGKLQFGYLLENSSVSILCSRFDSITTTGWLSAEKIHTFLVKYGEPNTNEIAKRWDYNTREFECYFVPTEKGKYLIEVRNGRIEMKAADGREWLVNPWFKLNTTRRYDQFLRWVEPSVQSVMYSEIKSKSGWYWFEVK